MERNCKVNESGNRTRGEKNHTPAANNANNNKARRPHNIESVTG